MPAFAPMNEAEEKLVQAVNEDLSVDQFFEFLLKSDTVMLIDRDEDHLEILSGGPTHFSVD